MDGAAFSDVRINTASAAQHCVLISTMLQELLQERVLLLLCFYFQ
jgi:hypothetical protein